MSGPADDAVRAAVAGAIAGERLSEAEAGVPRPELTDLPHRVREALTA